MGWIEVASAEGKGMTSRSNSDDLPMGQSMEAFTAEVRDTAYFLWAQNG